MIFRSIAFFAIALLVLASCTNRPVPGEGERLSNELTDSIKLITTAADFNGFGVALVDSTGVLYANGFGTADVSRHRPYTGNTVQPIASISKTFIGLAVMKAVDLGLLKLDDPVVTHLPFPVVNPHHSELPITVRHLVTHTSTILDKENYLFRAWLLQDTTDLEKNLALDIGECRFSAPNTAVSMEEFLRRYLAPDGPWYSDSAFADLRPGERFAYSNIGATLAALVVEKASGMSFDAFTQRHILDPLGMRCSTWHGEHLADTAISRLYRTRTEAYPRYFCATYPDGGMVTSADDFAKYMAELVKGSRGTGTLLSKESYADYFREQLVDSQFVDRATGPFTDEHNIGITIGFSSEGFFGHTGGDPGLFSMFFVERRTGLGRYMIVNTDLEGWEHHKRVWDLLGRYASKMSEAR
ncbi:MAG TPA: serine hydrolase domain-containing protein [Flavobacteriales bacterium]|nr:serine hydrolase domain-containing protein [Flavobacteriales bacterium]HMR27811.1 serine hydrolase domain-containing protein [Flavobacteriales bacterium]